MGNNCCKTNDVKITADKTVEEISERKEIPSGYGFIHAGVRGKDDKYTCPILEIHLWRKASKQTTINQASIDAKQRLGPLKSAQQRNIELEEEVLIIPIESILDIKYSSEVKKSETEYQNIRFRTPPRRKKCCCSKKPKYTGSEEIITTISNQIAQRKLLMTIEYCRYNNIHLPTHVQVLDRADQIHFYRNKFHIDILQFYLLDNQQFEQTSFELAQLQASTLCRFVIQLKNLQGNYPDEYSLQRIVRQTNSLALGEQAQETIGQITNLTVTTSLAIEKTAF